MGNKTSDNVDGSGSSHCSIDHAKTRAWQMVKVKALHNESKQHRQRAVAMFPIVVAHVAADMKSLLDCIESHPGNERYEEMADHYENVIREAYREWFGSELGQ